VSELGRDTGILICGHGSRNRHAASEFERLAEAMRQRFPVNPVAHGYLEFCNPVLSSGLDTLRDAGVQKILAVPGMLFAAGHAKNDIPSVLNEWARRNPAVAVAYGRELGIDPKMLRVAGERIGAAIEAAPASHPLDETLLVVVGRGSSDPDANSNVAKVTRMLWEGMGFGWAETAYSGVTFPLVEPALEHAARLGYRRIVVFPYFLFTGVLVKRIYRAVDSVAQRHPEIEFLKAGYLADHRLVIDTLCERVDEILSGQAVMNCQMCKYREQVLGFETEVALAQRSHHHHVEGVGGAPANCPCNGDCDGACRDEAFCRKHGLEWTPVHSHASPGPLGAVGMHHHHDHDHSDHHRHQPYPRADHPLGPKSLTRGTG
jgi:sirohydrochlorin cobaltochelatase